MGVRRVAIPLINIDRNTRSNSTNDSAEPTPHVLVVVNSPLILPPITFEVASPIMPVIA